MKLTNNRRTLSECSPPLTCSVNATIQGSRRSASRMLLVLLVVLMCLGNSSAYSVLTHEEIVDLLWMDQIRPLILPLSIPTKDFSPRGGICGSDHTDRVPPFCHVLYNQRFWGKYPASS